jgi:tetratricopeptide (TPR) repeat protein
VNGAKVAVAAMLLAAPALALAALASPASAQAPPATAPAAPPQPRPGPAAAKPTVDGLLNALRAAPTEEAAAAIEAQLRAAWSDAASPAIKLLLSRGRRELSENAATDSFDSFDAALDLDPDVLEAWRGRAAARLHMGDPQGGARDLQEVIRRVPRDFAAWQDLSRLAESRGDWRGAYAAWQKLLEIDPHTPGGQDRLHDLRRRAVGEDA